MSDDSKIPIPDYNEMYNVIEWILYPDHCPGLADARVARGTQEVFKALGVRRPSARCLTK
jgi:hypothetical protein